MPREQIEHDLREAQTDKLRIEEQIAALNREREQITMEEQLLAQVLRMHQWADEGMPGARETLEANAAAAPRAKRTNISANVLSIVRQSDGRPITPAEIGDLLAQHGIRADQNAIRVALRRWADRGEIVKEGRVYRAMPAESLIREDHQE